MNCAIQEHKHNAINNSKDVGGLMSFHAYRYNLRYWIKAIFCYLHSSHLIDQLEPAREETDDTSGNTMDLSRVNSSPSLARAINSSPNIGKTVDLPLTILGAPPRHQQHRQVLLKVTSGDIKTTKTPKYFQDIYEQEQLLNEFTSKFHMERSKAEEVCVISMSLQHKTTIFLFRSLTFWGASTSVVMVVVMYKSQILGMRQASPGSMSSPSTDRLPILHFLQIWNIQTFHLTDCIESCQLWEPLWRTKPSEQGGR